MYDKYENGECTIDQIGGHVIRFIILTQPLALGHIVATMNPGPLESLGTQPKRKIIQKVGKVQKCVWGRGVGAKSHKCPQFKMKTT